LRCAWSFCALGICCTGIVHEGSWRAHQGDGCHHEVATIETIFGFVRHGSLRCVGDPGKHRECRKSNLRPFLDSASGLVRVGTKKVQKIYRSASICLRRQSPMRASDSSEGGNADRVAKIQVGDSALQAAQGRLMP
jgi:hypothetical protein